MDSLSIKLKNCYGINSFGCDLSFEKSNANLIYAPNGVMKTSLAKTFQKISKGESPEEKLYRKLPEFEIEVDGEDIDPDSLLVIHPFDPSFESKNISTLLVNLDKKAKYDEAYGDILAAKNKLIGSLNRLSKIKKEDIEVQISYDLGCSNIFESIKVLSDLDIGVLEYSEIKYVNVFNEKVADLLSEQDLKESLQEYTERYNALIETSTLFKKGKFNPVNADSVSKSLKKEKFFEADHQILLDGKEGVVTNHADFEKLFEEERESILGDGQLIEISKKIISGVAPIKAFQEELEKFPEMSSELTNLHEFKKKIWASYYLKFKREFDELLNAFDEKKRELTEIEEQALLENTLWHEASEVFKARFHVPFNVGIENHTNAILGTTAPNMVFSFEGEDGKLLTFNRGQLDSLDVLSVGERRAMYLLYVIFEFKARLERGIQTLVVVDDIADSFDYKNKYAIIEYLKELADEPLFRFIVLTHNFDFYRTFQSRVLDTARWDNSYIAQKTTGEIVLKKGGSKDVSNPFELWKSNYSKNKAMFVSMIPFIRNLIEYKDGQTEDYMKLTSLLHIKLDTKTHTVSTLLDVMKDVIKDVKAVEGLNDSDFMIDVIYNVADELCGDQEGDEISLENKVTLSIATRLKAEEFMWDKVADKSAIRGNQTGKLFDRLCRENVGAANGFSDIRKVLTQVSVMTPENIHLNSFMYEPLMDMSNSHLVDLYNKVSGLKWDPV